MKNLKINSEFKKELIGFKEAVFINQYDSAWDHLERAHILGQAYWFEHLKVHLIMFWFAFKTKNLKEVMAQVPRIIVAAPGSLFNKAPLGNVGTGRVGIFKKMRIPEDLQKILNESTTLK